MFLPYCITIRKDDVVMKKAKIDHEDGGLVYEVEFFHAGPHSSSSRRSISSLWFTNMAVT